MSVSGTYFPPNLPNRPKESGRNHVAGSESFLAVSIGTTVSFAIVQRMEVDLDLANVNFLENGDCEGREDAKAAHLVASPVKLELSLAAAVETVMEAAAAAIIREL